MDDVRRRTLTVGAAVGACAVVAAAAGTDVTTASLAAFRIDERASSVIGFAFVVVLLLSIAFFVWAVWPTEAKRAVPRRRSWKDAVAFVVAMLLVGAIAAFMDPAEREREPRPMDGSVGLGRAEEEDATDEQAPTRPSPAGSIAVALAGIAALGLASVVARRRAQARNEQALDDPLVPSTAESTIDGAPADAVSAAIAAAHDERDPRTSIALAYRAAERAMRSTPLARAEAAPPREWLARVRARAGATSTEAVALADLVGRYEIARFSDHEPTPDDRALALAALDRIAGSGTRTASTST